MKKLRSCLSIAVVSLVVPLMMFAGTAFGQATIEIGSVELAPGENGSVDITLDTGGNDIAGTENDIVFGPDVQLLRAGIIRACRINPAIDRGASAFSFSPSGCTVGTDCESIKALVLSFTDLSPIPDGSVLYTCDIEVPAGTAPGEYELTCANPGASDPDGNSVDAACANGAVTVPDLPAAEIAVGSVTGTPGSTSQIEISLNLLQEGAEVAGAENVLNFPDEARVVSCAVNPEIEREASAFALSPTGCAGETDCESVKALILSFTNLTGIPDGSVLYTCDVALGSATGTFAVTCTEPGTSDPDGNSLTTTCVDGSVTIEEPTPVPTATPPMIGIARAELLEGISADATEITVGNVSGFIPPSGFLQIGDERIRYTRLTDNGDGTFTFDGLIRGDQGTAAAAHEAGEIVSILEEPHQPATETATAAPTDTPTSTSTPTNTRPPSGGEDDGCSVVESRGVSTTAWMFLLPMAGLLWLRRRAR